MIFRHLNDSPLNGIFLWAICVSAGSISASLMQALHPPNALPCVIAPTQWVSLQHINCFIDWLP